MTRTARHDERGLSDSIQWALLAPLIVLLVLGAVESAIVLQARTCVAHAALAGAEAQAVAGSPGSGAAQQAATDVTSASGLRNVTVTSGQGGGQVSVTVTAHVDLPIDLGFGAVRASATIPVER